MTEVKSLTNKALAGELRVFVNEVLESGNMVATVNSLGRVEEAARRLEFGYTPPEAPTEKSPLEVAQEKEKHAAFMAVANRLKGAGLGGHGIFVMEQTTGDAFIFTSHKAMLAYITANAGPRTDYRSLSLIDDLGRKFDICHNGDYGKKSFPAPVEE